MSTASPTCCWTPSFEFPRRALQAGWASRHLPGLAPKTYHAARQARDASSEVLVVVRETSALLNAVNVETLGRIESLIRGQEQKVDSISASVTDGRASCDQGIAALRAELKDVMDFLPTVREDMAGLGAQLDELKAEIQALPH